MSHRQVESRLVRQVSAYITQKGGRCFKIHGGDNPFQEVGIPDLLFVYRGSFGAVEVKQLGKKPSIKQLRILSEVRNAGGWAIVADSFDDVVKLLSNMEDRRSCEVDVNSTLDARKHISNRKRRKSRS